MVATEIYKILIDTLHKVNTINVYTDINTMFTLNLYAGIYVVYTLDLYADRYETYTLNVIAGKAFSMCTELSFLE